MIKKEKNLAVICARAGSKGIPNKNIRIFHGKPLIAHAILQAKRSGFFDRVIVDTENPEIAKIAKKFGAEISFRPASLASDTAQINDVFLSLIRKLRDEENYHPDVITLLQPPSPLREIEDIKKCYELMKNPKIKSVCTVCETHPRFYQISKKGKLVLINQPKKENANRQAWPKGYILNGCMVYMIRTEEFLKTKKFVNENTHGVICPRWRSIDLDHPEDWIMAELVYANKKKIEQKLKRFE
ncbi:MAG: acylneuraminate cytidylyltransferase family protein [Minisyncoccia bacterium]